MSQNIAWWISGHYARVCPTRLSQKHPAGVPRKSLWNVLSRNKHIHSGGESVECRDWKTMTARDVTGFYAFFLRTGIGLFLHIWGDFLTELHRKPGKEGKIVTGEIQKKSIVVLEGVLMTTNSPTPWIQAQPTFKGFGAVTKPGSEQGPPLATFISCYWTPAPWN